MNFRRQATLIIGGKELKGLRMMFDVDSGYQNQVKRATISVYGLNEDTFNQATEDKIVSFSVNDDIKIFVGALINKERKKDGGDEVSTFHCWSGGLLFRDKQLSKSFEVDTTAQEVITWLRSELSNLKLTLSLSDVATKKINALKYETGITFFGGLRPILDKFVADLGGGWRLDNFDIRIGDNVTNEFDISSEKGNLIGIPSVNVSAAEIESFLLPEISVGDTVNLSSRYFTYSSSEKTTVHQQKRGGSGIYKTQNIAHSGDTHGEKWQTKLNLLVKKHEK